MSDTNIQEIEIFESFTLEPTLKEKILRILGKKAAENTISLYDAMKLLYPEK